MKKTHACWAGPICSMPRKMTGEAEGGHDASMTLDGGEENKLTN